MSTLFENSGATFSECRNYRYALWRIWDEKKPFVAFIGLNPSTANESADDPTIKRVKAISDAQGFGGVYMLNLFPLVSTYPERLHEFYDTPFHHFELMANDAHLQSYALQCDKIVFAWGNFKVAATRANDVIEMFPGAYALHINKNGTPKHPLYCRKNTQLIPFTNQIPQQYASI